MDGKIDEIREALNELQGLIHHIERTTGHEYDSRKLHAAFKALSTIDPDAIRRECAYKAKQAILSAPYDNPTRAYAAALAEAAIFSAEPALNMPKCTKPDDAECHANSRGRCYNGFQCKPAQDDGKARFRCRDCNSEFDESVMEYYCDDEDGEGDYIGECPVCGSRNLAEVKRRIEGAKE